MEKKIRNWSTGSNILHTNTGRGLAPSGESQQIDLQNVYRYSEAQSWEQSQLFGYFQQDWFRFDDGLTVYPDPYEGYHRLMNFAFGIPFLSTTNSNRLNNFVSTNVQEALEEIQQATEDQDFDSMGFARGGNVGNEYLRSFDNLNSFATPEPVGHDCHLSTVAFWNSNNAGSFLITVEKVGAANAYRTEIYSHTFSGVSGLDKNLYIVLLEDEGVSVKVESLQNPRPQNIKVKLVLGKL